MTFRMGVEVDGDLDVPRNLQKHPAIIRALTVAAEHILATSNDRVPLETGTLMRSGRSVVNRTTGEASVVYDTPYAARQHEDLGLLHAPGRQAKYLESAMADTANDCAAIIARGVRRALGTD